MNFASVKLAGLLTTATFFNFATPALAEKIPADTPLLVLGSEAVSPSKAVKPGDVIVSSRVVYARLAIADEDIYGSDGKVIGANPNRLLLAKGAQMFGVVSQNGQITYCAVEHKSVGALEGVFVINRDKHTCFIDSDRDGRFDVSYDLRTKFSSTPIYYDVEVTGNPLRSPVGYTSIDPAELKLPIALEIEFSQLKSRATKATLMARLISGDNIDYFSDSFKYDVTIEASPIRIFGSEFTLIPESLNGLTAKISRGIPRFDLTTLRPAVYYNIIII